MNSNNILLIFLGLISLSLCFTIEQNQQISHNLQMTNFTGLKVDSAMSKKFVEIIKKSYMYHRDEILQNTEYIRSEIERTYAGNFCSVMIFERNATGGHYLNGNGVVAVWTKVIPQRPEWIYVIACNSENYGLDKISGTGAGSGVSASKVNVINNVIRKFQSTYNSCFGISQIGKSMKEYDGNTWNVVCVQKNNTIHATLNDYSNSYYVPNLYQNFKQYYALYSFKTA